MTLTQHRHTSAIRGTFHGSTCLSLVATFSSYMNPSHTQPSTASSTSNPQNAPTQTNPNTIRHSPHPPTMDEDLIALAVMVGVLLVFPLSVVALILACISYARTRAWDRARNQRSTLQESLLPSSSTSDDSDSEFYDTDDENEANERKAEESREAMMTFGQKWRKEFCKAWKGKGMVQIQKEREREERRKLARAVKKELERRERRAERKRRGEKEGLPRYEA